MATIFALFAAALTGCVSVGAAPSNSLKVGNNEIPFVQIANVATPIAIKGGKILIEPFEIDLALSDKARSLLKAGGETMQRRYAIRDLEIPADFYAPLADKDIFVNLNIISGRKSSSNNLISCDILEGRLSELAGRRFFMSGRLIRE